MLRTCNTMLADTATDRQLLTDAFGQRKLSSPSTSPQAGQGALRLPDSPAPAPSPFPGS